MKRRVISAAILIPLVLGMIWLGRWPFALLILVATLLAGWEYKEMFARKGLKLALPLIWAFDGLWLMNAQWEQKPWFEAGLALLVLLNVLWTLYERTRHPDQKDPTERWAMTIAGGLYLGMGGAYLMRLRGLPDGLWWTLTTLPVIWISDSAAYYVGRRYGRHKMAPTISPGKSWEGYAGEITAGLLSGALLGWIWSALAAEPITLTPWNGMILGGLLAILSPAGDFFISMMKREVGVKDSSTLIPGHGGVFDRIDSLLWAGIIGFAVATLLT